MTLSFDLLTTKSIKVLFRSRSIHLWSIIIIPTYGIFVQNSSFGVLKGMWPRKSVRPHGAISQITLMHSPNCPPNTSNQHMNWSTLAKGKTEVPRDVRNTKSPETGQVQERLVTALEHLQVPKGVRTRCPDESASPASPNVKFVLWSRNGQTLKSQSRPFTNVRPIPMSTTLNCTCKKKDLRRFWQSRGILKYFWQMTIVRSKDINNYDTCILNLFIKCLASVVTSVKS